MICLSYDNGLINPGVPLHRQRFLHYWHHLIAESDPDAPTFELSLPFMESFAAQTKNYSELIDRDAYPAAGMGYRYPQGNSHLAVETRMGKVVRFCLAYAPVEDEARSKGPSHFTHAHVRQLAGAFKMRAPNLVAYAPRLEKIMTYSLTPEAPSRACTYAVDSRAMPA